MHTPQSHTQPLVPLVLAVVLFISIACFSFAATAYQEEQISDQSNMEMDELAESENALLLNDHSTSDDDSGSQSLFDASSAKAWMNRLANTISQSSFEIAFVVSSSGRDTMPYVWRHAILKNGDEAEQLSLLNGPGFERVRINNKMSVFEPGFTPYSTRTAKIDGPIPMAFIHRPQILDAAYDVLLMGRNRVLGRMAQQIRIVSKDKTRYGYYLWLDEQTGLLLKMNMYSTDNRLLKQIQVTQLMVNDEVQKYFANIQSSQLPPISVPNVEHETEFLWTVGYLPIGMQKVKQKLHRLSTTGQASEYMMLSDGLVDVSVYVMNANEFLEDDLSITTDATSVASMSNGRIQVTVVGEIPPQTASQIADSIVLVEK